MIRIAYNYGLFIELLFVALDDSLGGSMGRVLLDQNFLHLLRLLELTLVSHPNHFIVVIGEEAPLVALSEHCIWVLVDSFAHHGVVKRARPLNLHLVVLLIVNLWPLIVIIVIGLPTHDCLLFLLDHDRLLIRLIVRQDVLILLIVAFFIRLAC